MSASQDKRLSKLEEERRPVPTTLIVWRDRPGDTTEQAIARRFPDGVPQGARLIVLSWQFPAEGEES